MCRTFCGFSILFLVLFIGSCSKDSGSLSMPPTDTSTVPIPPADTASAEVYRDNDNLLLGNPSNATLAYDNNYLMRKVAYTLSYSRERGIPNWVSWHLYAADFGSAPRQENFLPDQSLPFSWYAVTSDSYSNSGFDRGHDCPSGDRTAATDLNTSTFLMTNVIPQAPKLNQGPWNDFENYVRNLVQSGSEAYIVMGNSGSGGTGNNGYATAIDNGLVTVPAFVWKVVVVLPNGNNDTTRINTNTRVIAVQMPNNNSVGTDWKQYRTSVDNIEKETNLDILSRLPDSLQATLESKVDKL